MTVPDAHHAVTMEALRRGLPVLGEKPLAASLAEALEMVAAAQTYDRLFMVSQNRRYDPHLFAYRRQIRQLGRLGILAATFFKAPHFGGFRDAMAHPLVLDMAIHTFDSARFLTGDEPVAVYCDEYNPAWSWYAGDAAATASSRCPDGSRFVYTGSWCSDGPGDLVELVLAGERRVRHRAVGRRRPPEPSRSSRAGRPSRESDSGEVDPHPGIARFVARVRPRAAHRRPSHG